ncbi:MAG: hypothetical protein II874_01240 [Bacteroidales bacterium]|nr:hypothetical protein [Bacteroidales bacterium]
MKKIIYIAFAAAALAAVSCSKNAEFNVDPAEPGLTLTFTCTDLATRGEVDGKKNENRVDRIDYFFFPLGADGVADDTKPVYGNYMEIAPEDNLEGQYTEVIEPGVLAKIFPDGATKAMIFAVANYNGEEPLISGTAPVTDFSESELTWGYLHGLEVGATFTKDGGPGFGLRWPRAMKVDDPLLYFVMSADTEIELMTTGQYAVKATVPLERLASKVTASFTYENYLERKTYKQGENQGKVYEVINWVPQAQANETRVYLSNAICTTTLGGPLSRPLNPDGGDESAPWSDRDIFEYAYDFMKPLVDAGEVPYYYTYPFKKYEEEAEEAATDEGDEGEGDGEGEGEGEQTASIVLGDDNQPYLKLVLPWYGYKYVGTGDLATVTYTEGSPDWVQYKQKEVYYKIVLPSTTITEPNKIYEYQVTVNIIGSDKEVKLIGEEYIVKDWTSGDPISSNVATGRYISLDIPKDEYDMYVDEIGITFVSSGEVTITNLRIYQDDFSAATASEDDYYNGNPGTGANWATAGYKNGRNANTADIQGTTIENWVKIDGTKLKILHHMNNDYSDPNFDAAPFHFIATLHLVDAENTSFDRTVHITQYPAIYVIPETSNSFAYVNGKTSTYDDTYGYLWDDTRTDGSTSTPGTGYDGDHFLGTIASRSLGNSSNKNTNQYSVTVTILDPEKSKVSVGSESMSMIIGDPRGSATSLSNMSALGSGYRPSSDDSQTIVAPKLRIASSYGASARFTYEGAKKRCSAYQENGYPAGRWRLPTLAEIQFLITLSENGKIPTLFSPSYAYSQRYNEHHYLGYWSSGGWLYYGGSNTIKSIDLSEETAGWQDSYYDGDWGNDYGYLVGSNTYYFGATRCVYDEWYWGSEKVSTEDTWLGYMTSEN